MPEYRLSHLQTTQQYSEEYDDISFSSNAELHHLTIYSYGQRSLDPPFSYAIDTS